ncbi:MAG: cobalamin biosynthesis protein CobD [Parasporobacterium sp.]|nr:cobalamin biosynthesis protein CobD [Parasporobacterium sp.]
MKWSLLAILIGFLIDCIFGDPRNLPHPVVGIGKLISLLERPIRKRFPKTPKGERLGGFLLWLIVALVSLLVPGVILFLCQKVTPWLRVFAESLMCWQILAAKSLKQESMKVFDALRKQDLEGARYAVSMIVGRDTARLDEAGVTRAAVETVAENTSDGVIAPLFYLVILGAPFGFLYKAVNTMDSMLGYTDPPYTFFGTFPARADDVMNFIPARLSALLMLLSGALLKLDVKNGWRIFCRDRYKHASPNSAQTESVCAGLLGVRLAGDAWYHGNLHRKPFIGEPLRRIRAEDIPLSCRLMYLTAVLALVIFTAVRAVTLLL